MEELKIGKKVQAIRQETGLSIREVAKLANITPSMLSQIENEQVNPSINTLRAVAQVLNTPLYRFFKEDEIENPVVKAEERKVIGFSGEPDVRYELLTRDTKGNIEFCNMIIPPKMSSFRDIRSHIGEEVAFVHSGEYVELDLDGTTFLLNVGDSVRIPANASHVWHNTSDKTVHVIFAITPPSF